MNVSIHAARAFLTPLTGRGFPNGEPLVVDLLMAVGVKEYAVCHGIPATGGTLHDVMVVPSRDRGNRFAAVWTAPILALPEVQQGSTSFQRGRHLKPLTLLQVDLPLGIVGVDLTVDLGMGFPEELEKFWALALLTARLPERA